MGGTNWKVCSHPALTIIRPISRSSSTEFRVVRQGTLKKVAIVIVTGNVPPKSIWVVSKQNKGCWCWEGSAPANKTALGRRHNKWQSLNQRHFPRLSKVKLGMLRREAFAIFRCSPVSQTFSESICDINNPLTHQPIHKPTWPWQP